MPKQYNKHESGRSLIEVIGVMALGAVMLAGTFRAYQVIRVRQARVIAAEELHDAAHNGRLLFAGKNDYSGISVNYLIKMGALKTDRAPSVAQSYDIQAEADGGAFRINLHGVSFSDCAWLGTQRFDWASKVLANDFYEGKPAENCKQGELNNVTFIVR